MRRTNLPRSHWRAGKAESEPHDAILAALRPTIWLGVPWAVIVMGSSCAILALGIALKVPALCNLELQNGLNDREKHEMEGDVKVTTCPGCGSPVELRGGMKLGERVGCPGCGERLEVVGVKRFELDFFDGREEDREAQIDYLAAGLSVLGSIQGMGPLRALHDIASALLPGMNHGR